MPGPYFFRKDERVGLAVLDQKHADFFLENLNDPQVNRFLSCRTPVTRPEERNWIKQMQMSEHVHAFTVYATDLDQTELPKIGVIGLHHINFIHRHATSGAWITPEFWDKGYGKHAKMLLLDFAFHALGLKTIRSSAIATNPRSIAYNERCGYVQVGKFRKCILDHEGVFQDEILLEIIYEEWLPLWKDWKK